MIENFHAQVRHPHFVHIGEKKGIAHVYRAQILHYAAKFTAHITNGFFHLRKQRVDFFRKFHGSLLLACHILYCNTKKFCVQSKFRLKPLAKCAEMV
mgnify:CR=1 FL=1